MSFINKSIEDSLKLINSEKPETKVPKKRGRPRKKTVPAPSPVRRQEASPVDKFSPFRTTSRPSSPVALQRSPEAEERVVTPVTPTPTTVQSDDEHSEPNISATLDITEKLKSKYFTVVRYIRYKDELLYAMTYDPNGQVVFIELDSSEASTPGGVQTWNVDKQDYIDYPFALRDYYKDKFTGAIYGIVLTRGENMCFITRIDDGETIESYYGTQESINDNINTYCVFRYSDIVEDLDTSLQSIIQTYDMIQQHQLISNKIIYKTAVDEINKLAHYANEFDKIYKKYTENILDDWSRFSNVSVDYIDKLMEEELTEEENEKFAHISSNLFARFQAFNNISAAIADLKIVDNTLLPIKNILKDSIDQFEKDNAKISGKILDASEVDVLL